MNKAAYQAISEYLHTPGPQPPLYYVGVRRSGLTTAWINAISEFALRHSVRIGVFAQSVFFKELGEKLAPHASKKNIYRIILNNGSTILYRHTDVDVIVSDAYEFTESFGKTRIAPKTLRLTTRSEYIVLDNIVVLLQILCPDIARIVHSYLHFPNLVDMYSRWWQP